ncbi:MAG: ATPase, T2SS/T4P/T4SS family, partial [Planctomycetota bacterium]
MNIDEYAAQDSSLAGTDNSTGGVLGDLMQPGHCIKSISGDQLAPDLVRQIPLEFLKSQCAIPIMLDDGRFAVAISDPLNIEAYDAIVGVLSKPCIRVICPAPEIEKAISRCYYESGQIGVEIEQHASHHRLDAYNRHDVSGVQTSAEDLLSIANKAPAIKLANQIFFQAVHSRASDIHIEPYEKEARVRFRVDGVLHN